MPPTRTQPPARRAAAPSRQPATASPADLLEAARALMARTRPETTGLWPRAAALLARQALEATVAEIWREKGLDDMAACGMRQQLICLRAYVKPEVAGALAESWAVLTRACHHHAYEVAPTVGELEGAVGAWGGLQSPAPSRLG